VSSGCPSPHFFLVVELRADLIVPTLTRSLIHEALLATAESAIFDQPVLFTKSN
jgi:hypothetical protein